MWAHVNMGAHPMRKRRDSYHHGDLRRAILDAALEIVTEQGGAAAVTLREAARRVGVSHNAPYRHFEDRGAILAALAEEGFTALARALREARADVTDAEERFVATGLAYLAFTRARPGHVGVMFAPELVKGRTRALQAAANDAFQVLKELALDAGVGDPAEARRLGTIVWAFLHGLAGLAARKQIPPSVGAAPDELAALGLRRLFRSFARG